MSGIKPQDGRSRFRRACDRVVRVFEWTLLIIFILALVGLFIPGPRPMNVWETVAMQKSHTIGRGMLEYAIDHANHYPSGSSSTEVFQKLLDGKYVTDPEIFYLKVPGKTRPTSSHLNPENVSWDVTVPLDQSSSDDIPMVFCTGYRIEYKPGGRAIPLPNKSRPAFSDQGLAVTYHSNSSIFIKRDVAPDGSVPNFIPANGTLGATAYTQLTPDGPLPKQ